MPETVRVRYSCQLCGINEAEIRVPAREDHEDIKSWLQQTIMLATDDHARRQTTWPMPICRSNRPSSIMIENRLEARIGAA